MEEIRLPADLSVSKSLAFARYLSSGKARGFDGALFNLGTLNNLEPFGSLVVSSAIRRFSTDRKVQFKNATNEYAECIGLYDSFGLPVGRKVGSGPDGMTYIPVTFLSRAEIRERAEHSHKEPQDVIEDEAHRLARVLSQGNGNAEKYLGFAICEMMRNVYEHSGADGIWYMAQAWESTGDYEIAILDEGVGVRASLSKNENLTLRSDRDACFFALQPGITRDPDGDKGGHWGNFGFGLYMTREICKRPGGCLGLLSGSAMSISQSKTIYTDVGYQSPGTAVKVRLTREGIAAIHRDFKSIQDKAFELSKRYKKHTGIQMSASVYSRLIDVDGA